MFNQYADCSIIGGEGTERTRYACKLRQAGISTFAELTNRKRDKMFKRACQENWWGSAGVYDLDDTEDRAWLDRTDLAEVGV